MERSYQVLRVHKAAGVALVQSHEGTKWVPWDDHVITAVAEPSLALESSSFSHGSVAFHVLPSADGHPPQNVLLFLHGRGDSHEPFARLGAQMELPQTGIISLRAPLELPLGMGHTWIHDLDQDFNVIPPNVPHVTRSRSLVVARDFVRSFLQTLHERYGWKYERIFLFGFSQGACVAYHLAMTLPFRLGGVVLIAGGEIAGPHTEDAAYRTQVTVGGETPALLIEGLLDETYPAALSKLTKRNYTRKHTAGSITHFIARKRHEMIASREEMLQIMTFFSAHLYLRNFELENRSDIIELQR